MNFHFETIHLDSPGELDEELFGAAICSNMRGDEFDICWGNYSIANAVTVAWTESGRLAGLHVYQDNRAENDPQMVTLQDQMVWVEKRYRRLGLANQLWELSLAVTKPDVVNVFCISPGALELLRRLEARYPDITWNIGSDLGGEKAA